ncbi:MAG: poly-beta-hydroxybutyrate-responsive repressor [Thermoleophilia bacterium]
MSNEQPPDPRAAPHGQRRAEQPRSWLQPFLLLALEQWQSHGYELIRRMSNFGFETLDRGSVYRTLRQLEKDGLVISGWDTSKAGPARRLYSLTDAGRVYLETCAASLRGYQMMLNQFFTLYPWATAGGVGESDSPSPGEEGDPTNGNGNGRTNGAAAMHEAENKSTPARRVR